MTRFTRYLAHCGLLLALLPTPLLQAEEAPKDARLPLEELQLFAQVFEQIRAAYVEEIDDKTLIENAIVGLLGELDPHSAFLKEDSYKDLQEHTSGEFGGIGIEVSMEDGFIKVISPIDDTPASRSGIESGDLIIKLDNHAVQGMDLEEALNMMRGEKGTPLTLTIARENQHSPLIITVIRDIIKTASVRHKALEEGFGYIRIAQFQANTGEEFRHSIQVLKDKSPLKGLILDLRNNPGGLLPASVEVVDAMLDGGLVVYTEGRAPSSNTRFSAQPGELLQDIPLIILINAGSASASEIVAGAIQDHHRGVIMGTGSFGKGSVQNILPLSDGRAIKLTTARYFTPNGRSIQAEGIQPDIWVDRGEIKLAASPQAGIKEADLAGHLSQGETKSPATHKPIKQREKIKDYQLTEALNLLKGLAILSEQPPVN
ncbi:MAG: S41 family peptidase [Gammaproteobacteria bacterium]|nr:S41 family peptidase [Gammaproteobacteria bacterium]MBQ0841106.1 S41 family peptidase [Gammaproteobacteria bacterium]